MAFRNTIIGYIHICQKEGWKRSFDILMEHIKTSQLYEQAFQIRLGVLSDDGHFVDDERFHDSKMKIVYQGHSEEFERPTLLHIKTSSTLDPPDSLYFYVHTKGLRHFGSPREPFVLDWMKLMLYWNIDQWKKAVEILSGDFYWTYGCNFTGIHYSGNFWWAKGSHIRERLSDTIPDYYTAPEDWVTMLYWGEYIVPIHKEYYSVFNSGHPAEFHYENPYPKSLYS